MSHAMLDRAKGRIGLTTRALRRAACMIETHRLARTGQYAQSLEIEQAMLEIYPEASAWFDLATVRMGLRAVCDKAYQERQLALSAHDAETAT